LDFDFSSLSGQVEDAYLKLYCTGVSGDNSSVNLAAEKILESWSECNPTYSNNVTVGDLFSTKNITGEGWYSFRVTSQVERWINGPDENYGLHLASTEAPSRTLATFYSRHASVDQSLWPRIEIEFCDESQPCDLIPYNLYPLNMSEPFNVGDYVQWDYHVLNLGPGGACNRSDAALYITDNPNSLLNPLETNSINVLKPGEDNHDRMYATFTSEHIESAMYAVVKANWEDEEDEGQYNNNTVVYGPFEVLPPPGIEIEIDPISQSVAQNNYGEYQINISPLGGYSDSVDLSILNVPTTCNYSLNQSRVSVPGSAILSVEPTITTMEGQYEFQISASGSGTSELVNCTLDVIAIPQICLTEDSIFWTIDYQAGWSQGLDSSIFVVNCGYSTLNWDFTWNVDEFFGFIILGSQQLEVGEQSECIAYMIDLPPYTGDTEEIYVDIFDENDERISSTLVVQYFRLPIAPELWHIEPTNPGIDLVTFDNGPPLEFQPIPIYAIGDIPAELCIDDYNLPVWLEIIGNLCDTAFGPSAVLEFITDDLSPGVYSYDISIGCTNCESDPLKLIQSIIVPISLTIYPNMTIDSTLPYINQIAYPNDSSVLIYFGDIIDNTSVTDSSVLLYGEKTGLNTGLVSVDVGENMGVITPLNDFSAGERSIVTLANNIKGFSEERIWPGYTWQWFNKVTPSESSFPYRSDFASGPRLHDVCCADIDGDGDPDVITTEYDYPGKVHILLNDGNGSLTYLKEEEVAHYPIAVEVVDIDWDGDLDILTITDLNLSILRSNGDLTFVPHEEYTGNYLTSHILWSELNGDGFPDVLTGDLTFYFGQPSTDSLEIYIPYDVPQNPITCNDFNIDGIIDIAYLSDSITILEGLGLAQYSPIQGQSLPESILEVVSCDINSDGIADIIAATTDALLIYTIDDTLGITLVSTVSVNRTIREIDVGDIEGDNDLDIVVALGHSDSVGVYLNDGMGTSFEQYIYEVHDYCLSIELCDMNNDDRLDIVAGNFSSGDVTILSGVSSCCQLRGDVSEPKDGNVLINDIVFLVDYLFRGGIEPVCYDEGDCAIPLDSNVLVNDIVWLVDYLFKAGQAPPDC